MTIALWKALAVIFFFGLLTALFQYLPDGATHPVPPEVVDAMTWMYAAIAPMDFLLPLRLMLDLFLLSLAFELVYWIWYGIRMIISWVRNFF